MFETGLQYVRADFHLHTRKDKEFSYSGEPNSFVKDYVSALLEAHINIGVITNHNKFDKEEYKAIRKKAKKEGIYILPGVELAVKEGKNGVHTLIVFNPEEWLENGNDHINTFLTTAFTNIPNSENANSKCNYDLKAVFEKLDTYGRDYFVIFAHVDQDSGLFEECEGGIFESLSRINSFRKCVLGLQKSRNYENRKNFKKFFQYVPALVEGSDPKSIENIGKGDKHSYLKIGEYSYSAIKFALQDHRNRVSTAIPDCKYGYIDSISFQGGKFDGQTINFSPELNTLIGIRGSGKSSILEAIRYVLGIPVGVDKDYKESLIKEVLGSGGKATLTVIDKQGEPYKVSRILNESPSVFDKVNNKLNIKPICLFSGIQYFGQKDLSSSIDRQRELSEKLTGKKICQQSDTDSYIETLATSVKQLLDLQAIPAQINEISMQKNNCERTLAIFQDKGIATKLKKQSGYVTDETKIKEVIKEITEILQKISTSSIPNSLLSEILEEYTTDFNQDIFENISEKLSQINVQLNQMELCVSNIRKYYNDIKSILSDLQGRKKDLEDEFAEIKREIRDDILDVECFSNVTEEYVKATDSLKQLNKKISLEKQIKESFLEAKRKREDILLNTHNKYKAEIDRINNSQDKIRITVTFEGDKEGFKSHMKEAFKGTNISESKYQKISDHFKNYVDVIEDWIINNGNNLKEFVTESEYNRLEKKLAQQYKDLLGKKVQDKVDFYYHNKLLRQFSIGERASALLLFILSQSNNDLIFIDQPEDDLDNQVIYKEVISAIVQYKTNTQFIFATHNANIPVLGDSERVLVVQYQEEKIDVEQGNIDQNSTHTRIVDIMEGGQEAFNKRRQIYSSWQ